MPTTNGTTNADRPRDAAAAPRGPRTTTERMRAAARAYYRATDRWPVRYEYDTRLGIIYATRRGQKLVSEHGHVIDADGVCIGQV